MSCDLAGLGCLQDDTYSADGSFLASTPIKPTAASHPAINDSNVSMYDPINDSDRISNASEAEEGRSPEWEREYYLVACENLWDLLCVCPKCCSGCLVNISKRMGSFVTISRKCCCCDFDKQWHSQPFHGNLPAGNLKMAASIHFNVASPTKTLHVLKIRMWRTSPT